MKNQSKIKEKIGYISIKCDTCGVSGHDEKHMFSDMSGTFCSDCWQTYLDYDEDNHYDETRCQESI